MSFGVVAAVAVGIGAISTINQMDQARKASNAQKDAQKQAAADARKQADLADQATNKANRKTPDLAALLAGNAMAKGVGTTSLTGPQGVDTSSLTLGKNQLLGS